MCDVQEQQAAAGAPRRWRGQVDVREVYHRAGAASIGVYLGFFLGYEGGIWDMGAQVEVVEMPTGRFGVRLPFAQLPDATII